MPIIVLLLLVALVATFGFWGTLKAILGAIGVIILLCLLLAALVADGDWLVGASRRAAQKLASKAWKRRSSSHCWAAFSLAARNDAQGGDGSAAARHLVQARGDEARIAAFVVPQARPRQEAVFDAVAHQLLEVGIAEVIVLHRADIFMGEVDALDARIVGRQRHRHAELR